MKLEELIETCDRALDGEATSDETSEIVSIAQNIFSHLVNFAEDVDYSTMGCSIEYLLRNKDMHDKVIDTFDSIIGEVEEYFND